MKHLSDRKVTGQFVTAARKAGYTVTREDSEGFVHGYTAAKDLPGRKVKQVGFESNGDEVRLTVITYEQELKTKTFQKFIPLDELVTTASKYL